MMLSPDAIFPVPLIHINETNSTNSYLQAVCDKQEVGAFTTVLSDYQSAGRGQRGNSWESERGKNLLFSFVFFPDFLEAKRQFLLSQIISLAIKEELDTYTNHISIKWPNDIYWKEKKICGMLIENNLTGKYISQSIAGIGINMNQREFFSSAPNPVSLGKITGKRYDLMAVLNHIMQRVKAYYALLQQEKHNLIATRYQEALFRREGQHQYKDANGTFFGEILRVEPEGAFILKDEKGCERRYMFKEVKYLL